MGQASSRKAEGEIKIFMHSLSGEGASLLYRLKPGKANLTYSGAFFMQTASFKNISFTSWDLGGRCYSRPLARHYYSKGVDAILFVVDSCETCKYMLEQVRDEWRRLLEEEYLKDTTFLVLSINQDQPESLSVQKLTEELDFFTLTRNRDALIMGCSAENEDGLYEALEWVTKTVMAKRSTQSVDKPEVKTDGDAEKKLEQKQGKTTQSIVSRMKSCFLSVKTMLPKAA